MLRQKLIAAVKDAQDRAQKHMQEMIDAHGRHIQKVYDVATGDLLIWRQEVSYTLNTADVINMNSHLARMLNNLGASRCAPDLAETVAENYAACTANREQLIELQDRMRNEQGINLQ